MDGQARPGLLAGARAGPTAPIGPAAPASDAVLASFEAARRGRASGRCAIGLLLAALHMVPPALAHGHSAPPSRVEAFSGEQLAGTLAIPVLREDRLLPAVVILYDTLGPDTRGVGYAEQLEAAGIAVLDLLVEDHAAIRRAVALLAADPRIDPQRIGVLGFGAGALAAVGIVAGADGDPFAARALLYPGCAMLRLGFAQEPSAMRLNGPVLLLHGEADPTNTPKECADLVAELRVSVPELDLRRVEYRGAGYAWDRPQHGLEGPVRLPVPGGPGHVRSSRWPELAQVSRAQVAAFFARSLRPTAPSLSKR